MAGRTNVALTHLCTFLRRCLRAFADGVQWPPAYAVPAAAQRQPPDCPLRVAVDVVDGACSDAASSPSLAVAARKLAYIARQVLTALLNETFCVPRAMWVAVRARKRCERMLRACTSRQGAAAVAAQRRAFDRVARGLKLVFAEVRQARHVEHALSRDVLVLGWIAAARVLGVSRLTADDEVVGASAAVAGAGGDDRVDEFARVVASTGADDGEARAPPSAASAWRGAARALSPPPEGAVQGVHAAAVPLAARFLCRLVDELRDVCRVDEASGRHAEAAYALAHVTCVAEGADVAMRAACGLLSMPRADEPRRVKQSASSEAQAWAHVVIHSRYAALAARASGGDCEKTHATVCAVASVRRAAAGALRWRRDVALQGEDVRRCVGSRAHDSVDDLCGWPRLEAGAPSSAALRKAHHCGVTFARLVLSREIKLPPCAVALASSSGEKGQFAVRFCRDSGPQHAAAPAPAPPSLRHRGGGTAGAFCSVPADVPARPRPRGDSAAAGTSGVDSVPADAAPLPSPPPPPHLRDDVLATRKRARMEAREAADGKVRDAPAWDASRAPKLLRPRAAPKRGARAAQRGGGAGGAGVAAREEDFLRIVYVSPPLCLDPCTLTRARRVAASMDVARMLCGQVRFPLVDLKDPAGRGCGRFVVAVPQLTGAQRAAWMADEWQRAWRGSMWQQVGGTRGDVSPPEAGAAATTANDDVIDRAVRAVRRSAEQRADGTNLLPLPATSFPQTAANVRAGVWQDVAESCRGGHARGGGDRCRASVFATELILTLVFRYVFGIRDNTLGDVFVCCCDSTDQLGAVGAPEVAMLDSPPDFASAQENVRREKSLLREAMRSTGKCSLLAVLGHVLATAPPSGAGAQFVSAATAALAPAHASRALDVFAARHDVAVQTCLFALGVRDARFEMCKTHEKQAAYVGGSSALALYTCLARCSLVLQWHEMVAPEAHREATRRHEQIASRAPAGRGTARRPEARTQPQSCCEHRVGS